MGRQLNKRQKNELKRKIQEKKKRNLEKLDIKGISHHKHKFTLNIKVLFVMKLTLLPLMLISYFFFSTWLAYFMIFYVSLFFVAIGCEHQLNRSVIKSNHIKIPKYDSGIALLLVLIGIVGAIFGISQGRFGHFENTFLSKVVSNLKNFGTLLTGQRSLFGPIRAFGFGIGDKPEGFIPNGEALNQMIGDVPPGGRPDFNISMDNIPIKFMFSQILSTVDTFLIFAVIALGIISLITTYKKLKKYNHDIGELIVDGEIQMLSSEEMNQLLSYGDTEEKMYE